jgi:hypothetical protein
MNGLNLSNFILLTIFKFIEWILVPAVLLVLWYYGFFLLPKARSAARYAGWAGLIIFVLFVVSRKGRGDTLTFRVPEYDFNWWLTAVGTFVGFVLRWLIDKPMRPLEIAVMALVLVSSSSISIYSYLFIQETRPAILFVALGCALGILLEKAFLE